MLFHLNTILRRLHFVCLLEKIFLKCGLQDNHWVRHSVKKPVDDVEFQKIKTMRERKNYEINNFEIEILDERALDKALIVTEKI